MAHTVHEPHKPTVSARHRGRLLVDTTEDNFVAVPASYLHTMRIRATTRFAVAACALSSSLLCAQTRSMRPSKTTPTAPVAPQAIQTQPAAPPRPLTPAEQPAQSAEVTYANGLLTVTAHNSSLNQILRDISRETHMKITGGVLDERVFGSYGPEPAAQVLNSLLDGTSSNMLLIGSDGPTPTELILTPRSGGPTPPSPMAASLSQSNQPEEPPSREPYDSSLPAQNAPANPPETTPEPPAANQDSGQQQPPNGVKTPQDIFNQLMKLRQQQSQQQNNQQ